jgi:LssY-like putative type I secretion system component LssY
MCRFSAWLSVCCLAAGLTQSAEARQRSLNLRLTTAITSYHSRAGSQFQGVVIAPYERDGQVYLPPGTIVHGSILKSNGVGLGIKRERASLRLAFHEYELPDGRRFPLYGHLHAIDNARERVDSEGEIKGILAANGPQSLIHGLWAKPSLDMFRSFVGLTGTGGKIFTSYSMGPVGAAGLFAARLAIVRLPEPEIRLPRGTELKVSVNRLPEEAPSFEIQKPGAVESELGMQLARQPFTVTKPGGAAAADIINVAFLGSKEDLTRAFGLAGWSEAERLSARSFSKAYKAYSAQRGYDTAPVSKLLYEDAEPDLVFQKSLNTMAKRHHIRLWRYDLNGREIWLGAATHDVGIVFDSSAMSFTHQIQRRIDAERLKVVNDLSFTGCIAPPAYLNRSEAARAPERGGAITDGRLAVLNFVDACKEPSGYFPLDLPAPPKSRAVRIVRRMMLEGRQYALRGNAYYWAYRALAFRKSERNQITLEE